MKHDLPWNEVDSLPIPGMMIVARRLLKAWESDVQRGENGLVVNDGDVGLVLQVWREGGQVRIRVLIKDTVALFSHARHVVWLNWAFVDGWQPRS